MGRFGGTERFPSWLVVVVGGVFCPSRGLFCVLKGRLEPFGWTKMSITQGKCTALAEGLKGVPNRAFEGPAQLPVLLGWLGGARQLLDDGVG